MFTIVVIVFLSFILHNLAIFRSNFVRLWRYYSWYIRLVLEKWACTIGCSHISWFLSLLIIRLLLTHFFGSSRMGRMKLLKCCLCTILHRLLCPLFSLLYAFSFTFMRGIRKYPSPTPMNGKLSSVYLLMFPDFSYRYWWLLLLPVDLASLSFFSSLLLSYLLSFPEQSSTRTIIEGATWKFKNLLKLWKISSNSINKKYPSFMIQPAWFVLEIWQRL